jgi:hypothetical protein
VKALAAVDTAAILLAASAKLGVDGAVEHRQVTSFGSLP